MSNYIDLKGIKVGDLVLDLWGCSVGFLSFFVVFLIALILLQRHDLNRKSILSLLVISGIGHYLGGLLYYWFSIHIGSDSDYYFQNPTLEFKGFGYAFAFFVLGYLKEYVVGESFLGAFLFFSALSYLGSVFYLLTYKVLLDKVSVSKKYFLTDPVILLFPTLLLLCWPSYFFWGAGLVKDSFAFLSIGIFLFVLAEAKLSILNILLLIVASLMGFMVRPYLFIVFCFATFFFILFGSKWNVFIKTLAILLIVYVAYLLSPFLANYGASVKFSDPSITSLGVYAVRQQARMQLGSSIPLPTSDPHLMFLFLPYLMVANMFLPLFIGALNFIGLISSIENIYFLLLVQFFLKNKNIWYEVKNQIKVTKFFIIFFLVGMAFLSMMNTNLGLAMREKMMYVPAFLIVIFLVYAYRRILIVDYLISKDRLEITEDSR